MFSPTRRACSRKDSCVTPHPMCSRRVCAARSPNRARSTSPSDLAHASGSRSRPPASRSRSPAAGSRSLRTRRASAPPAGDEVLSSHLRSLMPGHLTDVASTNQHNVKPWFNGRVDFSPSVPNLDSAGFPLLGGRLDYVDNRPVAALVYGRREHKISVYSWPAANAASGATSPVSTDVRGYHLMTWNAGGLTYWAVSDVNRDELRDFVRAFTAAR